MNSRSNRGQKTAESLIPRKEKHKKMIEENRIAKSTECCFIVPCLERSFGFKANEFAKNTEKLSPLIEQKTFEHFVRQGMRGII